MSPAQTEREQWIAAHLTQLGRECFPDDPDVDWIVLKVEHREPFADVEAEPRPATVGYPRFRFVLAFSSNGEGTVAGCYIPKGNGWSLLFSNSSAPQGWKVEMKNGEPQVDVAPARPMPISPQSDLEIEHRSPFRALVLLIALGVGGVYLYGKGRMSPAAVQPQPTPHAHAPVGMTLTASHDTPDPGYYATEAGIAYKKGLEDLNRKDPRAAIRDFTEAIRLNPEAAEPYQNRGIAYDILGHHEHALEDYDAAIRLKPDNPSYYFVRGMLLVNMGKLREAEADCERLQALDPNAASDLRTYMKNR